MRNLGQLALLISIAILLTACASATPIRRVNAGLSEEVRAKLDTVGVAAPHLQPKVEYMMPAKGRLAGAGRGAGIGALGTTAAAAGAARGGGREGGAAAVVVLVATPVTALIGAIVGVAGSESREKVEAAEKEIKEFSLHNDAGGSLNEYFMADSKMIAGIPVVELSDPGDVPKEKKHDYTYLAGSGIDTVAEVAADSIYLEGQWNINPDLLFMVTGHVRLVNTADGTQLFFRTLQYRGPEHEFCEWAADNACLMREETDRACREMAECAVEEAFLVNEDTEYADPAENSFYGLRPAYPAMDGVVSSLRPVIRWAPFPRPRDKAISGRVSGVIYDLKVWKAGEDNRPEELVFSKHGITGSSHAMETALLPSTDYLWSVRARYLLDGNLRSTLWGMANDSEHISIYGAVPRPLYYRFRTPSR